MEKRPIVAQAERLRSALQKLRMDTDNYADDATSVLVVALMNWIVQERKKDELATLKEKFAGG